MAYNSSVQAHQIKSSDLQFVKKIGVGGYSTVFEMLWKTNGNKQVAVKKLNKIDDVREVEVLLKLEHTNIVQLLGVVDEEMDYMLVLEYCHGGDLRSYLDKHIDQPLSQQLFYDWLEQAAKPVQYLKKMHIIHKDIKSRNYVITQVNTLKLADFGLAKKSKQGNTVSNYSGSATYAYMAPELAIENKLSHSYDIFALAVVIWELLTRQVPFKGKEKMNIMYIVCNNDERLPIPSDCPVILANLLRQCWDKERTNRPSIDQVMATIKEAKSLAFFVNDDDLQLHHEPILEDTMGCEEDIVQEVHTPSKTDEAVKEQINQTGQGESNHWFNKLKRLLDQGFNKDEAEMALKKHNMHFESALNELLETGNFNPPPQKADFKGPISQFSQRNIGGLLQGDEPFGGNMPGTLTSDMSSLPILNSPSVPNAPGGVPKPRFRQGSSIGTTQTINLMQQPGQQQQFGGLQQQVSPNQQLQGQLIPQQLLQQQQQQQEFLQLAVQAGLISQSLLRQQRTPQLFMLVSQLIQGQMQKIGTGLNTTREQHARILRLADMQQLLQHQLQQQQQTQQNRQRPGMQQQQQQRARSLPRRTKLPSDNDMFNSDLGGNSGGFNQDLGIKEPQQSRRLFGKQRSLKTPSGGKPASVASTSDMSSRSEWSRRNSPTSSELRPRSADSTFSDSARWSFPNNSNGTTGVLQRYYIGPAGIKPMNVIPPIATTRRSRPTETSGPGYNNKKSGWNKIWRVPLTQGSRADNQRPPPGLVQPPILNNSPWKQGSQPRRTLNRSLSTRVVSWSPDVSTNWLVIRNLIPQIDESTLRLLCNQNGPLEHFCLNLSQGTAFIAYRTQDEATRAQLALNGLVLGNTPISVNFPTAADMDHVRWAALGL